MLSSQNNLAKTTNSVSTEARSANNIPPIVATSIYIHACRFYIVMEYSETVFFSTVLRASNMVIHAACEHI